MGKFCFELSPQGDPMIVSGVTRGLLDDCNSFAVGTHDVWLRISRRAGTYAFHASTDGTTWRFVRYFVLDGCDPALGLEAQSSTGSNCTAVFDHVSLRHGRVVDIRDGSQRTPR